VLPPDWKSYAARAYQEDGLFLPVTGDLLNITFLRMDNFRLSVVVVVWSLPLAVSVNI
jgi:hypothetical protein